MNIALIGYGKMGKIIETIALQRGHQISLKISNSNKDDFTADNLKGIDAAIEFTHPEAAFDNVMLLLNNKIPTVCGTTGWNDKLPLAEKYCNENKGSMLCASNFSLGVNIFFEVNKYLAAIMNRHTEYNVKVEETHHTQKKDAPSGTAITIAEQILQNINRKSLWTLNPKGSTDLEIAAHRIENVPGTHNVKYDSVIDSIEIIHTAHSREGFALGAVLAAEFIANKQGVFSMKDVLFS